MNGAYIGGFIIKFALHLVYPSPIFALNVVLSFDCVRKRVAVRVQFLYPARAIMKRGWRTYRIRSEDKNKLQQNEKEKKYWGEEGNENNDKIFLLLACYWARKKFKLMMLFQSRNLFHVVDVCFFILFVSLPFFPPLQKHNLVRKFFHDVSEIEV